MKWLFSLILIFISSGVFAQVAGTPPTFSCSANQFVNILNGSNDPTCSAVADITCTDCIGDTEITTHAGTSLAADLEEEAHCSEHDSGDLDCSGETLIYAADSMDFTEIVYGNTLGGNPALAADECFFMSTATGGCFICEGSTADTNEQAYCFPDVNGADTSQSIVVDTAVQTLTNKTLTAADNTIEADTGDSATSFFSAGTLEDARLPTSMAGKTFTGTTDISERLDLTGDITPPQITANQNDYNPTGLSTATVLRLSSDAHRNITGLAGGSDGRILVLNNVGTNGLHLAYEDASSTAANRFVFPSPAGGYYGLRAKSSVTLIYDGTASRWRIANAREQFGRCEAIIEAPGATYELFFCVQGYEDVEIYYIRCQCQGSCSTAPTIKVCKGRDLGDDTCTTNLLSATESTTLTCGTTAGEDFVINSGEIVGAAINDGVTVVVTNTPSGVTRILVDIFYNTIN